MIGDDFRDLLCALRDAEARFLVVGGYAVGIHGRPRATKDLDVWVDATPSNAPRVMQALTSFGAPLFGLTVDDFKTAGIVLQIGLPPNRIDVITRISGVTFKHAWARRIEASFAPDVLCPVIGFDDLLANKRASGRLQDLADVDALERLSNLRSTKRPTAASRAKEAPEAARPKRGKSKRST